MVYTQVRKEFSEINITDIDSIMQSSQLHRNSLNLTGIICTIGPASSDEQTLTKMLHSGMRVGRLNFSHGTHDEHKKTIDLLKKLRNSLNIPFAIALDTKGPEIRTGDLKDGLKSVPIEIGSEITVSNDKAKYSQCFSDFIYCDYPALDKLTEGTSLFIDDGNLQLKVEKKVDDKTLMCKAVNGGVLSNKKGVNLPNQKVDLPAMTEKDKDDLRFGVEQGVDMIFASFIRSAAHVLDIKKHMRDCGDKNNSIYIIPKIENNEGMENFKEILEVSEAIMAARGDLGIETMLETVPLKQKYMARLCNEAQKPFIIATQMLESMIKNPRATRAEVYDVAGAILDGASCVMLSGESAKGSYPVEAVQTQSKVASSVEYVLKNFQTSDGNIMGIHPAESLARSINAPFIISTEGICEDNMCTPGLPVLKTLMPTIPVMFLGQKDIVIQQSNIFRSMFPVKIDEKKIHCDKMSETVAYFIREACAAYTRYMNGKKVDKGTKLVMVSACPGSYNISVVESS